MDKTSTLWRILLPGLCILFISGQVFGQQGIIRGKVTTGGLALEFANIVIARLNTGATTNASGQFIIKDITAGTYELTVSMMGYQTEKVKATVTAGQTLVLNIGLKEDLSKLNEIVVTGVSRATAVR